MSSWDEYEIELELFWSSPGASTIFLPFIIDCTLSSLAQRSHLYTNLLITPHPLHSFHRKLASFPPLHTRPCPTQTLSNGRGTGSTAPKSGSTAAASSLPRMWLHIYQATACRKALAITHWRKVSHSFTSFNLKNNISLSLRPYKCKECGDSFARRCVVFAKNEASVSPFFDDLSDLLSRHVNKCHPDVTPHTAGVPTKSSSRKKTCDQCSQTRTKCDSRVPCGTPRFFPDKSFLSSLARFVGNCVFHNIPCSRGSGTAEYVPSVSSQLYNHRASASTGSLPELSGAHHRRRLSDSGSASSRGSYSTTGSVGNIGFGGIQLSDYLCFSELTPYH